MDNIKFGLFISELRKEKDLTQTELAEMLHVTDKAVSRWECGLGFPDIKMLEPLAIALNVSLLELLRARRNTEGSISTEEADKAVSAIIAKTRTKPGKGGLALSGLFGIASIAGLYYLVRHFIFAPHFFFRLPLYPSGSDETGMTYTLAVQMFTQTPQEVALAMEEWMRQKLVLCSLLVSGVILCAALAIWLFSRNRRRHLAE